MAINQNTALAYLEIDRRNYDSLIDRLVSEVKEINPASKDTEGALKNYFATALTKGTNFANIKFEELAKMSPTAINAAANALPDKLSQESREAFAQAAEARVAAMRWNKLFEDGSDDITLSLSAEAQSVDQRIGEYIDVHNKQAEINFAQAQKDDPRNAGKTIEQRQIRRDENDPARLQTLNPKKNLWESGQRLGAFLEANMQWDLLDDFQLENSRKKNADNGNSGVAADLREFIVRNENNDNEEPNRNKKSPLAADQYDPDSLSIIISRDPQKIGEMSSGQHWRSCMSEIDHTTGKAGVNFHFVPRDIEAGSLVAYLVSKDDTQARYPLMRQLLKPHYNQQTGETALIPAKIYGADIGGNSRTRQALHDSLNNFVREKVNVGKSGEFIMDSRLYGDGQPGLVNLQAIWSEELIRKGLIKYHDSSLQEYMTELKNREEKIEDCLHYIEEKSTTEPETENTEEKPRNFEGILATSKRKERSIEELQEEMVKAESEAKSFRNKISNLNNPEALAKGFFRETRKTSPDSLPSPQDVLDVAKSPEITTRHTAINTALINRNTEPLTQYLTSHSLAERIEITRNLATLISASSQHDNNTTASLWKKYAEEFSKPKERVAEASKVITSWCDKSFREVAVEIILNDIADLTPKERLKSAILLSEAMRIENLPLAKQLFNDIDGFANSRERLAAAEIALKTAISCPSPETEEYRLKIRIAEKIHKDIETIPSPEDRVSLANRVMNVPDVSDDIVQNVKNIITKNVPGIGGYNKDSEASVIDNIRNTSQYKNDNKFRQEFDDALSKQKNISSTAQIISHWITEGNNPATFIEKWKREVNELPNPEWRLASVANARKSIFSVEDGKNAENKNSVNIWKSEAAKILLDNQPQLPEGFLQAQAFMMAARLTTDKAAIEQIQDKTIDIVSDDRNNMTPKERLEIIGGAFQQGNNDTIDLDRPMMHKFSELIIKYAPELVSNDTEFASVYFNASFHAKPDSEIAHQAAHKFREHIEKVPVEERRMMANQIIQMVTLVRDHPVNISKEIHGGEILEQAKAILEGIPYIPMDKTVSVSPKNTHQSAQEVSVTEPATENNPLQKAISAKGIDIEHLRATVTETPDIPLETENKGNSTLKKWSRNGGFSIRGQQGGSFRV